MGHASPRITTHHHTSPHITTQHHTSPHITPHHHTSPHITTHHHTSPHITTHHHTSPHNTIVFPIISVVETRVKSFFLVMVKEYGKGFVKSFFSPNFATIFEFHSGSMLTVEMTSNTPFFSTTL